jgi:hypothetical protein
MALSRTSLSPSFMTIPAELRSKILSLACTHDETIMPQQLAPGSGTFSLHTGPSAPWGTGYCPALTRKNGVLPPELSPFDIERTCQTAYDIVHGDKLFYTKNEFEFCSTQSLLDYLVVLPSDRRNAIRSVRVKYDYLGAPVAAFSMLAVCYGLENLTLDISGMTNFFDPGITHFGQAPGNAQLMALRGLKSVKLDLGNKSWTLIDDILARIARAWVSQDKAQSEHAILRTVQQLEVDINQETTQSRPSFPLIGESELRFAMNQARVSVWGDTINSALTPPSHSNTDLPLQYEHDITSGINATALPVSQPELSEQEQWQVLDRTHLATWDV